MIKRIRRMYWYRTYMCRSVHICLRTLDIYVSMYIHTPTHTLIYLYEYSLHNHALRACYNKPLNTDFKTTRWLPGWQWVLKTVSRCNTITARRCRNGVVCGMQVVLDKGMPGHLSGTTLRFTSINFDTA